jgi:NAD(P)-dependent dehydrogenase (short-subunit alcohol dehydrogenase family)
MNKEKDSFSLKGKVVMVTGATGVLGLSFINAISNAGGIVGVMGRNEKVANERVEKIIANGGEAIALIADVMNREQLVASRDMVLAKYGRIDGLVNGAGGNVPEAIIQPDEDVFNVNMDGMRKAMEVNLWGTVSPTLIFGKAIAENGGGSIVNISSVSAERTLTKVLGYSLGKAAVDCFTKWFAVELAKRHGDKIRMNSIMPGFFLTEQNRGLLTDGQGGYSPRGTAVINHTPFNRFGNPEDLEGALIWMLSDASKFITGTKVSVDGGFSAFSGV